MPLVWAHSEHIKLLRSLADGAVFDMPPQGVARYIRRNTPSGLRIWRFNNRLTAIPTGKALRITLDAPARIHWSLDGWATTTDTETTASGFGTHFADRPSTAPRPARVSSSPSSGRMPATGKTRILPFASANDATRGVRKRSGNMQIAMVGLGRMGANMVRRLLKYGHDCVVFDVNPDNVAALVKEAPPAQARRKSWSPN